MLAFTPGEDPTGLMTVSSIKIIFGSILASIAFVMELTLVPLLLPAIQSEYALTTSELSWVFNSYGFAVAVGVLMGGWLGDTLNSKRVFGLGVLVFAAGSAVVALAGIYEVMLAGRIIQGFGGGVFSALIPLLLTNASPNRPGKILIVWGSVAGYVAAFAPFVYGTTLESYDWNAAFLIFAAVALIALAIVSSTGTQEESASFDSASPDYFRLLRTSELWVMFVYVFCSYGAITYFLFRFPLWMAESGFNLASIGFNLSIMWLSFSFVSTLLRNKVDKPHVRVILLSAPLLIAAGFPAAYFAESMPYFALASFLVGSGLACSNAPSTQLILEFAPREMRAASVSLDITFARLGGVVFVGVLAQATFGYSVLAVTAMSAIALLCAASAVQRIEATD